MTQTVVGLFSDYDEAGAAVNDLHKNGFSRREVSLLSREGGKTLSEPDAETGSSAGTGAALGGAAGMVLGLAALAVPGIGPIVAAGPLAAALAGAGIGAAAGGMIGALSQMGIPEQDAGTLAKAVERGGTLVAVRCDEHDATKAERILERHGAIDVDERSFTGSAGGGWSIYDPHSDPGTYGDEGSPSEFSGMKGAPVTARRVRIYHIARPAGYDYDSEFRRHFETTFYMRGSYEEFASAYRYGHALGSDPRYSDVDWAAVEPDARSRWEADHPGSWDRMKDAVRHAWDYVRGRR